jgi:hypothetical protein
MLHVNRSPKMLQACVPINIHTCSPRLHLQPRSFSPPIFQLVITPPWFQHLSMQDVPDVSLEIMFPNVANRWTDEPAVISGLMGNEALCRDLVNLLESWLDETQFERVFLHHTHLYDPLHYDRGEGERSFSQRLMGRLA